MYYRLANLKYQQTDVFIILSRSSLYCTFSVLSLWLNQSTFSSLFVLYGASCCCSFPPQSDPRATHWTEWFTRVKSVCEYSTTGCFVAPRHPLPQYSSKTQVRQNPKPPLPQYAKQYLSM